VIVVSRCDRRHHRDEHDVARHARAACRVRSESAGRVGAVRRLAGWLVARGRQPVLLGAGIGLLLALSAASFPWSARSEASEFVSPQVTAWGLGRGLLVGGAIGVLGGLYPAWRVKRLRPAAVLAAGDRGSGRRLGIRRAHISMRDKYLPDRAAHADGLVPHTWDGSAMAQTTALRPSGLSPACGAPTPTTRAARARISAS